MKLSDIEKGHLKILLNNGYKYVARDDCGVYAFKNKPVLHISRVKEVYLRFWKANLDELIVSLPNNEFLNVGFIETEPYIITENATLKLCKSTKKAVAV